MNFLAQREIRFNPHAPEVSNQMLRERENPVDIDPFDSCFLKFHFRECQLLFDSVVLTIVSSAIDGMLVDEGVF